MVPAGGFHMPHRTGRARYPLLSVWIEEAVSRPPPYAAYPFFAAHFLVFTRHGTAEVWGLGQRG